MATAELESRGTGDLQLGRLQRYSVLGLFNERNISFDLAAGGPTLLTGTNGTGKSTILRTIYAVGTGKWLELLPIAFDSLRFDFDTGHVLVVEKGEAALQIRLDSFSWLFRPGSLRYPDADELPFRTGARRLPGGGSYELNGRVYSRQELLFTVAFQELVIDQDVQWILEVPERFPVAFITDKRLFVRPDRPSYQPPSSQAGPGGRTAVNDFPRELRVVLSEGLSTYAAASQDLDRVFPRKLADALERQEPVRSTELRELLSRVAAEREALQAVGLLSREQGPVEFDERRLEAENVRPVIQAFAEDTLEKFATLSKLRQRLEIFVAFVNSHYRGKRLVIDRERGFILVLSDGSLLRPSQLSSGEQQILVLAFEVLFRTEPGTLLLIDEPELSLHVLWQESLIDDLAAMGRARDLSFILASHSPTLIGDRDDLERSLDLRWASEETLVRPPLFDGG